MLWERGATLLKENERILVFSGNFANIWKAKTKQHPIAIKESIHPRYTKNVFREYCFLKQFSHTSIPHPYSFECRSDGCGVVQMEWIDGVSAQRFVSRIGYPDRVHASVQIIADLAAVLVEVHDQNIVHRDIKSDNVLVQSCGKPILLDFGLAYEVGKQNFVDNESSMKWFSGTHAYTAPECRFYLGKQLTKRGHQQIGLSSDIFSLGVLLYRLLTGRIIHIHDPLGAQKEFSSAFVRYFPKNLVVLITHMLD